MKKNLFALLCGVLCLCSCSNDVFFAEEEESGSVENVVFTVEDWKVEPQTRSTIDFETGQSSWSGTKSPYDRISVVPNVEDTYGFVTIQYPLSSLTKGCYANGVGTSLSTTSNSGWNMKNGVDYIAYYPAYTAKSKKVSFSLSVPKSSRTTVGGFKIDNDVMWTHATAKASTIEFKFERKYALIGVALTNLPVKTWKSLTISNKKGEKVFGTKGTLNVQTGEVIADSSAMFSSYIFSCPTTSSKKNCLFTIFPTLPTTTGEIYCLLEDVDGNKYEASFESINVEEGHYYPLPSTVSQTSVENGHEFVDLGLSVKWATMNVGATSPEDYGNYYVWGETEPKDMAQSYNDVYAKYNSNDNLRELENDDDAAYVNWGAGWRMPTKSELEELVTGCYWEYTDNFNGAKGFIVYKAKNNTDKGYHATKGKNKMEGYSIEENAYIFLPYSKHFCNPDGVYLWSKSRRAEGEPTHAYILCGMDYYISVACGNQYGDRHYALPVRPVLDKK